MVTIAMLWLPILVATALVFAASSLAWMVLPHHRSDTRRLPDEAGTLAALARQGLRPGVYRFPWSGSMAEMKDPAFLEKLKGPVGLVTVRQSGVFSMGRAMGAWVAYVVVIGVFVAYVASRTLAPDTPYPQVFRVAGTVAILAYAGAHVPDGIWWGKPWKNVAVDVVDGVVYGLLTAGSFAGFWPR
jgi:hypothetical protein